MGNPDGSIPLAHMHTVGTQWSGSALVNRNVSTVPYSVFIVKGSRLGRLYEQVVATRRVFRDQLAG